MSQLEDRKSHADHLASAQLMKTTGKEWDIQNGLYWLDFGARLYDPVLGSFTTLDPLTEKYYHLSPYAYCANNPMNYVDPDGRSPIYDPEGNFLGTDDLGLKGMYYVLERDKFKQGMPQNDVLKALWKGVMSEEAKERMTEHFSGLYLRPDWDGYVTLKEANEWYQKGNGQPLYVDLGKIDLSGIFSLGEKNVGQEKVFNLFFCSNSLNDARRNLFYLATATARVSRMTVIFTCPG